MVVPRAHKWAGRKSIRPEELAAELDVPLGTVKSRLNRARRELASVVGLHLVPRFSLEVEDPVPVDLVVAEVFGNFALEEGVLDPLEMRNTSFWVLADQEQRYARSYVLNTVTNKLEETKISYLYNTAVTDRQRPPLGGAAVGTGSAAP